MVAQFTRIAVISSALLCGAPPAGNPRHLVAQRSPELLQQRPAEDTFVARVEAYAELRDRLANDLLAARSDVNASREQFLSALAAAIRQARRDAQPGDIVGAEAAHRLASTVRADFANRDAMDQQEVLAEVPRLSSVRVNDFYPEDAPLATMPPLLLQKLEPLPPELQYRFLGTALILIDVDTRLIVDVVPNAFKKTT